MVCSADFCEDIAGVQDFVFLVVDFDFGAAVFGGQDDIADSDFRFLQFAVVIQFSGTDCDNLGLLRFSLAPSGI